MRRLRRQSATSRRRHRHRDRHPCRPSWSRFRRSRPRSVERQHRDLALHLGGLVCVHVTLEELASPLDIGSHTGPRRVVVPGVVTRRAEDGRRVVVALRLGALPAGIEFVTRIGKVREPAAAVVPVGRRRPGCAGRTGSPGLDGNRGVRPRPDERFDS